MKRSEKMVEIFNVYGENFLDEERALEYEREIDKLLDSTFYLVTCDPDVTGDKGYLKTMIVVIPPNKNENTLIHFLYRIFGAPLKHLPGFEPVDNWLVLEKHNFISGDELSNFIIKRVKEDKVELKFSTEAGLLIGSKMYKFLVSSSEE